MALDTGILAGMTALTKISCPYLVGSPDLEAPASSLAKRELKLHGSQASAWEPEELCYFLY
jgi:hypothetical protein